MSSEAERVLSFLGLQHYLPAFLEAGFDDWDALSNITESDLISLNVRLGHRRKLQREIARGLLWPDNKPLPTTEELQKHHHNFIEKSSLLTIREFTETYYSSSGPTGFASTRSSEFQYWLQTSTGHHPSCPTSSPNNEIIEDGSIATEAGNPCAGTPSSNTVQGASQDVTFPVSSMSLESKEIISQESLIESLHEAMSLNAQQHTSTGQEQNLGINSSPQTSSYFIIGQTALGITVVNAQNMSEAHITTIREELSQEQSDEGGLVE